MKVSKDNKRILIIIAAIVALIVAYQQIPHIYIGERAQGRYEGGSASDEGVSKAEEKRRKPQKRQVAPQRMKGGDE
ncbi:hypothetical protein WH297_06255 [Ochrobactrum vermis]|uniref:Uncharacterized protein n=1 Tax=Ochrobactrum vermis TaxID=1827297 RepID=A0ABU8PAR7_9HYPH|nr:hypothetical protein [Ochrobactrum vermis]